MRFNGRDCCWDVSTWSGLLPGLFCRRKNRKEVVHCGGMLGETGSFIICCILRFLVSPEVAVRDAAFVRRYWSCKYRIGEAGEDVLGESELHSYENEIEMTGTMVFVCLQVKHTFFDCYSEPSRLYSSKLGSSPCSCLSLPCHDFLPLPRKCRDIDSGTERLHMNPSDRQPLISRSPKALSLFHQISFSIHLSNSL